MKQLFLFIPIFILSCMFSAGQGTVRGKITDEKGETVIGAAIVLKSKPGVGTVTDFDGNFSLKITDSTAQTIVISLMGFNPIEKTVHPVNGGVVILNLTMTSTAKEIGEVQITAKASKNKEYYVESIKKNSAVSLDYVSSETMVKTGDANVVAAVARVSGVSTSNGGLITVRGIGDRYVKTSLNGSRIPTLDPFTNNIKLDMFPASLVDNVLITKTASPDLPGDWAGAYISVETKEYPEQLLVNVETTVGYNNQSTFNDVITSQRSSTDWLGHDDGFREHSHDDFVPTYSSPSTYQEFVALGLGDYYNSIGVTSNTTWNDTYYKLGLIELGLLAPGEIDDNDAFIAAKNAYVSGSYQSDAFKVINANAHVTGQSFPSNWDTQTRTVPINFSQSFSVGNQISLFGKPLGFLTSFRYGTSNVYDPTSSAHRLRSDGSLESSLAEESSKEYNGWSALLNLAYKLHPNHSISLLFMPNVSGMNNVRSSIDDRDPAQNVLTKTQFYEERKQSIYQFKSEHYIPASKIKAELNASYTKGTSGAPDFKNLQYYHDSQSNTYQIGGIIGDGVHRYYRYLKDDIFDSRLSAEFPLGDQSKAGVRKFKFGGGYQYNKRKSDQYDYNVNMGLYAPHLQNNDLDAYFSLENFGMSSGFTNNGIPYSTINMYYNDNGTVADHTFGNSTIVAAFAMVDYSFSQAIRVSGGLRIEHAKALTDVYKFDSLGYGVDDLRRAYKSSNPLANPGTLDEISYLPSINFIYRINHKAAENETSPINLRANFSQTVARPSIRELSDVQVYDYEYRSAVFGNSLLKPVRINNYDLRFESYFKSGDNVSMSLFYKDFNNHIEMINSGGYTWQNVDDAHVAGVEFEARKKVLKHFDLGANVTFVQSSTTFVRTRTDIDGSVKTYIPLDTVTHPMFGQAPYVLNGILTYTADSLGLGITLSYNVQGPRLIIASSVKEIPDVYETPRHLLDCKLTQKISKHFSATFTVRDILNSPIKKSYRSGGSYVQDYETYTYGTNYVLGISYKL